MSPSNQDIFERLVIVEQTAKAAHHRVDKTEAWLRDDLGEIKKGVADLTAWMNRGKGWAAAGLLMSGIVGGLVVKFVSSWGGRT